jgi:hypothetical protein
LSPGSDSRSKQLARMQGRAPACRRRATSARLRNPGACSAGPGKMIPVTPRSRPSQRQPCCRSRSGHCSDSSCAGFSADGPPPDVISAAPMAAPAETGIRHAAHRVRVAASVSTACPRRPRRPDRAGGGRRSATTSSPRALGGSRKRRGTSPGQAAVRHGPSRPATPEPGAPALGRATVDGRASLTFVPMSPEAAPGWRSPWITDGPLAAVPGRPLPSKAGSCLRSKAPRGDPARKEMQAFISCERGPAWARRLDEAAT